MNCHLGANNNLGYPIDSMNAVPLRFFPDACQKNPE